MKWENTFAVKAAGAVGGGLYVQNFDGAEVWKCGAKL